MYRSAALALLCLVFTATVGHGQLRLSSTIRDFRPRHPNMDVPLTFNVFQFEQGIVEAALGEDGKPVFNQDGAPFITVTNETDFHDWYHDAPGTNLATEFDLEFTGVRSGWLFGSTSIPFRPIDGRLFGNQDPYGNNLFTLEMHAEFTYEGGEFFRVSSDDDAWLFIDGKLVLDAGGIHDVRVGSQAVDLDSLGLTVGENYPFDFFYAERARQGYLSMRTDIRLRQGPPELRGDFNLNGGLDPMDLDMLSERVRRGVGSVEFDLTEDAVIDDRDRDFFVRDLVNTLYGDSDFNGKIEFADFLQLARRFDQPGGWSQGDFDGSGDVAFPDFLLLSANFGQSVEAVAVAEPACTSSLSMLVMCSMILNSWRRAKRSLESG